MHGQPLIASKMSRRSRYHWPDSFVQTSKMSVKSFHCKRTFLTRSSLASAGTSRMRRASSMPIDVFDTFSFGFGAKAFPRCSTGAAIFRLAA
jgi:hypothetical protein